MEKRYTEEEYNRWLAEYMSVLHIDEKSAKNILDEALDRICKEVYSN